MQHNIQLLKADCRKTEDERNKIKEPTKDDFGENVYKYVTESSEGNTVVRMLPKQHSEEQQPRTSTLTKTESAHLEEKVCLRRESTQTIRNIYNEDKKTALSNLSSSANAVFKENSEVRSLLESFKAQIEDSYKVTEKLSSENKNFLAENEDLRVKLLECCRRQEETTAKVNRQSEYIKRLEKELQEAKSLLAKQREQVNTQLVLHMAESTKTTKQSHESLLLERRRANRVYNLAKRVLEQRNAVEWFFLSALDHVRNEINIARKEYVRDSKTAYETGMRLAHYGAAEYPKIRTFRCRKDSTHSLFDGLKSIEENAQFHDLTWEQKERVLSYLFAQINAGKPSGNKKDCRFQIDGAVQEMRCKAELLNRPRNGFILGPNRFDILSRSKHKPIITNAWKKRSKVMAMTGNNSILPRRNQDALTGLKTAVRSTTERVEATDCLPDLGILAEAGFMQEVPNLSRQRQSPTMITS